MEQNLPKKHQYKEKEQNCHTSLTDKCGKKEVLRKCLSCGEIKNREELIRIMRSHDTKALIINPDSKHFGRSAYICYNKNCVKEAFKKKKLQKYLKTNIEESFLTQLESILN